jgi:excisionase family DNA binding protein
MRILDTQTGIFQTSAGRIETTDAVAGEPRDCKAGRAMTNSPLRSERETRKPLAVSPTEGARLLGVSRTTFYSILASGEIASFRLGRRRLIRTEALESWLRTREAEAQPDEPEPRHDR